MQWERKADYTVYSYQKSRERGRIVSNNGCQRISHIAAQQVNLWPAGGPIKSATEVKHPFLPPPRNFSITLSLDLRALVWNEYKTSFQQFTYNNSMAAGACEHIQLEAWTQAVSKQRHARHCTPHTDPEGSASARHHNKEVFITRPNYNRLLAPIHFADRQEKSKVLRINSILTFSITLFSSLYLSFLTCTGSVVHFFPY